jgi:hypothetical protein
MIFAQLNGDEDQHPPRIEFSSTADRWPVFRIG